MKFEELVKSSGEWLRADGPECGIVISSRVRLARNLFSFRFESHISSEEKENVADLVKEAVLSTSYARELCWFDLESLTELERHLLLERHLISREQEESAGARGVVVNEPETLSIMVNEEDHLRLQSLRSGLQLEDAYEQLSSIDDELAKKLDYAFDEEFGYLTACPTNVGTGMRVSVMVHLPALVMSGHIEKAFNAVHDLRLAVRGLYGEGTEAHGEFYQISNQITIGRSEEDILADLKAVIEGIVNYEKKARERLLGREPMKLEDKVWRAYSTLKNARLISSDETMRHLSSVRLGAQLGMLPELELKTLNTIFLYIQPAHLQKLEGKELPPEERDVVRARYIREHLS